MTIWPAADLFEFCRLIRLLGDCTFQRLEREELTIQQAIALLRAACGSPAVPSEMTPRRSPPVLRVFRGGCS